MRTGLARIVENAFLTLNKMIISAIVHRILLGSIVIHVSMLKLWAREDPGRSYLCNNSLPYRITVGHIAVP